MARFRFDGREFEQVERALFGEAAAIERQAKVRVSEMVDSEQMAMLLLVSLRRGGVMLSWQDMMQLSPTDFEYLDEGDSAPVDEVPPTAGAEAGAAETATSGAGGAA